MTTKHTPGPWKDEVWDYPLANPPRKDLVVQSMAHPLAVVAWDEGKDNPYTIPLAEARANARLFAAASKMYELLIAMRDGTGNDDDLRQLIKQIEG
jgi:hypothetical protein